MKNIIPPMLAKKWDPKKYSPVAYYMSEKLDGVRAIWTGERLISRNGSIFWAPEWFTKDLPENIVLDGELWAGRGQFQHTAGTVRQQEGDWSQIRFGVFDVIRWDETTMNMICEDDRFGQRKAALKHLELPEHCFVVEHVLCESQQHLDEFEQAILDKGGEGVMLRQAGSKYQKAQRSDAMLKLKHFKTDEAKVIGHTKGDGHNLGRVGALICEYQGKIFKVGSGLTDNLRDIPPKVGDWITFSYFDLTRAGIPRFPGFIAVRDYE